MKSNGMHKLTVICPHCRQTITTYPLAVADREGVVSVLMVCPVCGHGWRIRVDRDDIFGDDRRETPKK